MKSLDEILCRASDGETQEYETRYRKNGVFIGHDKNRLIPIRNSEGINDTYGHRTGDEIIRMTARNSLPCLDRKITSAALAEMNF